MRKKIFLFIFTLFISIIFVSVVSAAKKETICKYTGNNANGTLTVEIRADKTFFNADAIVDGYLVSKDETTINHDSEMIENWRINNYCAGYCGWLSDGKDKLYASVSGFNYYIKNGCPPYTIMVDKYSEFQVFVATNEKDKNMFVEYGRRKQGFQLLTLVDEKLLNKDFTIEFINTKEGALGKMDSIIATYGVLAYLPENNFKLSGFSMVGYNVNYKGKWLCEDGYQTKCDNNNKLKVIGVNSQINTSINFDHDDPNPVVKLYTVWENNANIDSQTINQYNLGKGACTSRGYVWVDTNGGYCNTDKLQYVTCGDSFDIPIEVPNIISYLVNLLKIATPIVLIVVSIVTLLKALASSNEDEIKKAQKSLIRKVIAAVMVFFVVSIVQFVVLKVADSFETKSISSCMSCFLNNDCNDTTYYKTNIGGNYFCTEVTSIGREDIIPCNDFYEGL